MLYSSDSFRLFLQESYKLNFFSIFIFKKKFVSKFSLHLRHASNQLSLGGISINHLELNPLLMHN